MAQSGADGEKKGLVSGYPDNVKEGVVSAGDNFTPLSMATREDGPDVSEGGPNRNERDGGYAGWVLTPGID